MRILESIAPRRYRLRPPGRTIRLRLTILYASLFLASGVGLLTVTYVLVRHATGNVLVGAGTDGGTFVFRKHDGPAASPIDAESRTFAGRVTSSGKVIGPLTNPPDEKHMEAQIRHDRALAEAQHTAELHQLLEQSGIALLIMSALSIGLGWLAAGRVLRPLRTINERAREISAHNLHRRLALSGPDDELTQLASTFDDLLGRLEGSFAAQRQFVANASHELRTPLARAQTVAEVALADPRASVDTLRASHLRVLAAGRQQERLIEALLTLARSERGLDELEPFDVATVTRGLLDTRQEEAERAGISVRARLAPAAATGNPQLAERLVTNLVDNAIRHNVAHGSVDVETSTTSDGRAVLTVSNSGPAIPPDDVDRLFLPFQRLGVDRTGHGDGVGLGLSIVAAIAAAHGAQLDVRPRSGGGLSIAVAFPSTVPGGSMPAPRSGASTQASSSRPRSPALRAASRRERQPIAISELCTCMSTVRTER